MTIEVYDIVRIKKTGQTGRVASVSAVGFFDDLPCEDGIRIRDVQSWFHRSEVELVLKHDHPNASPGQVGHQLPTITQVEKIRHEIAELEADIADHLQADKYLDGKRFGKRFGNERLHGTRLALSFARGRLIAEAQWPDLLTDDERDAWLVQYLPIASQYLSDRLQLARDAAGIPALRRRTISAETQLAGAKAQIALLVSAGEKALVGDTEALVVEIGRAKK